MPDSGRLFLSSSAYASAQALAYSAGCRSLAVPGFGCALAQAVASAQSSDSVAVHRSSPPGTPIRFTLQASAYAEAVAQAQQVLGSGRCAQGSVGGAGASAAADAAALAP